MPIKEIKRILSRKIIKIRNYNNLSRCKTNKNENQSFYNISLIKIKFVIKLKINLT